jgi:hypothetical protein
MTSGRNSSTLEFPIVASSKNGSLTVPENPSASSSDSTPTASLFDSIVTSSPIHLVTLNSSQSSPGQYNHTVSTSSASSGRPALPLSNSSVAIYNNYSITSPLSLPLYLTTYVEGNSTATECPMTGVRAAAYRHGVRELRNQTCCRYYNSDLDTFAFSSWIFADSASPSPSLSPRYACCGECTVRAPNIQLYYWPGAEDIVDCPTYTTGSYSYASIELNTTTTVTETYTLTMHSWAYFCRESIPAAAPYTTVINNFTMTSPTMYVRLTSLTAYNYCGRVGTFTGKARL